jgi:D-amino-acid dehydrogenase
VTRVVVVGAGVVGLCTAWALRRRGHEVVVLDGATVRDSASWGNAGLIVPSLSAPVPGPGVPQLGLRSLLTPGAAFRMRPDPTLLRWLLAFTRHCTRAAHDHGTQATLDLARDVHASFAALQASGVCVESVRTGLRFVGSTRAAVEDELALLAPLTRYGYDLPAGIDAAEATCAAEPLLGDRARFSAHLAGDGHLDPRELVAALESWLSAHDVLVRRDAGVDGFAVRAGAVSGVVTEQGSQDADAVVIAAGAWSGRLLRDLGYRLPLQAGKGYSASVDLGALPRTPLYLLEARVAVTPMAGRSRLAGMMDLSGVDSSPRPKRVAALVRQSSSYLPSLSRDTVRESWAGLRPMTPDGLPVIGAVPGTSNAFVATGHAMLGVTLGPVTGEAVAGLLAGEQDERLRPFAPGRFG